MGLPPKPNCSLGFSSLEIRQWRKIIMCLWCSQSSYGHLDILNNILSTVVRSVVGHITLWKWVHYCFALVQNLTWIKMLIESNQVFQKGLIKFCKIINSMLFRVNWFRFLVKYRWQHRNFAKEWCLFPYFNDASKSFYLAILKSCQEFYQRNVQRQTSKNVILKSRALQRRNKCD